MVVALTGDYFLFLWQVIISLQYSLPRVSDIIDQILGALRLGWRPIVAVNVPFGMAFGFNFDSLLSAIGARAFAGGSIGPSVIRQAGPLVASTIVIAVVGAAFCADLGARKVKDEIAASEVMAVNPLPRLVIPRVIATIVVMPIMYVFACAAAVMGGFLLLVMIRSANVGSFLSGFQQLIETRDFIIAIGKCAFFGFIIGSIACFYGFRAEGGPSGVASKVRSSIIASTVIVFIADFVITSIFYL